jgi:hypothetical protein
VPAVPIVRPIITIVRIRSVIAIGVIPIITRIANPNSDRDLSVRTLHWNESQPTCHQCN